MSEADEMRRIQVAASKIDCRLFRNNVGQGWVGKIVAQDANKVTLAHYRTLHAGLCDGSSDLIGWKPTLITPEMVGLWHAVFTAVEVKSSRGSTTKQQRQFLQAVETAGGNALVARSVEDAIRGLGGEKRS